MPRKAKEEEEVIEEAGEKENEEEIPVPVVPDFGTSMPIETYKNSVRTVRMLKELLEIAKEE